MKIPASITLINNPLTIIIHPHSGWYFIFGHSREYHWLRTSALFIGLPAMQTLLATRKRVLPKPSPLGEGGNPSEWNPHDAVDGWGVAIEDGVVLLFSFFLNHGCFASYPSSPDFVRSFPQGGSLSHNSSFAFSLFLYLLIGKASIEPRDYRVVFVLQKRPILKEIEDGAKEKEFSSKKAPSHRKSNPI